MTEQELQEIEARCEAATAGPWLVNEYYACVQTHSAGEDLCAPLRMGNSPRPAADADFAAHARTDLPRLISALREARADAEMSYGCLDMAQKPSPLRICRIASESENGSDNETTISPLRVASPCGAGR